MVKAHAYYNEIDPYAALWIENLILEGVIAYGDVDRRSIEDVRPSELAGYTQCHFFAGLGGWSYALRLAGWGDERSVWTGSCPCQPFSAAGKGGGTADERHLWPSWYHLIEQLKPQTVFGEQVASPAGLGWFDLVYSDMEEARYACAAVDICAAGVGAPHIRQRLYWVAQSRDQRREGEQLHVQPGRSWLDLPEAGWGGGGVGELAHGGGEGLEVERQQQTRRQLPPAERSGEARELANTDGWDTSAEGLQRSGQHGQQQADGVARSELGHTEKHGIGTLNRESNTCNGSEVPAGRPSISCVGELADSRYQHAGRPTGSAEAQSGRPLSESAGCSFWSDVAWIPCRDGKWRPVEPGTFPLAHGVPARVGRLRAYGNAICAPLAAEFVRAYLEIT